VTDLDLLPQRGCVRRSGWLRLSRGLYVPTATGPELFTRVAAWNLVLPPTSAFSHLTAAELRGWWQPAVVPHPVFAALWETATFPRRPGLVVSRHATALPTEAVHGVRVTSAAETMLALSRDLGVLDLVVLGDSALHLGHLSMASLAEVAGQRRRGVARLREVIPLLDGRSESPWESVLRMLHWAAQVPVEPQHKVHDEFGRFVARGDLWVVGTRRLNEYDGAGHRDQDVHRSDLRRERRLVEIEWQRVGFVAAQLLYEAGDIIAGLDRLLGRPWDPRRLARWNRLLQESMLRPAGRARLLARWS
jgi:hypothetical protein